HKTVCFRDVPKGERDARGLGQLAGSDLVHSLGITRLVLTDSSLHR
ncbi:MAG: hypothetical protein QOG75_1763, partial [Mycobacterium sp.]|nr:hypothetical protein [Mycobacterium sp.]